MKKVLISLAVVAVLAIGVAVYAQGTGWGGNYTPGYGYHMMGQGYGGHMIGWRGGGYDQKYLDETADVRKELTTKKFEYFEAIRNPKTNAGVQGTDPSSSISMGFSEWRQRLRRLHAWSGDMNISEEARLRIGSSPPPLRQYSRSWDF
ncbi:MAG: hypothetical protein L6290_11420 [Thermodesulfovibrionales bacterium]|nr:hypothetical protein [Thermodesulfovibrionales bacterium]